METQKRKRKRFINWISAILLLVIISVFYKLYQTETVTIETIALNVRKGPGLTYDVTSQATRGQKLIVLDKKMTGTKLRQKMDRMDGLLAGWLPKRKISRKSIFLPQQRKKQNYMNPPINKVQSSGQ